MGRPLGSFTGYTPGDGGLLGDMEDSWGCYFEQLTQSEKLWLLSYVTGCDSLLSKNIEITQCIA